MPSGSAAPLPGAGTDALPVEPQLRRSVHQTCPETLPVIALAPQYLLRPRSHAGSPHGRWEFRLERVDGSGVWAETAEEPGQSAERLDLLAVIRGLEALDQPSRVTVLSSSRYVIRGITQGLETWRQSDWSWESFGRMVPIKHRDLWQRLDRAVQVHQVECCFCFTPKPAAATASPAPLSPAGASDRTWRLDPDHTVPPPHDPAGRRQSAEPACGTRRPAWSAVSGSSRQAAATACPAPLPGMVPRTQATISRLLRRLGGMALG